MKKKLLVIVGAGASLEYGMPSVNRIGELMEDWSKENFSLVSDPSKTLYTWVMDQLQEGIFQKPNSFSSGVINFESILFTCQTIATILKGKPWYMHNTLPDIPDIMQFGKATHSDQHAFHFMKSQLVDNLLKYIRDKCKTVEVDKAAELNVLNAFFLALEQDFEIGFINLNYDNVILKAKPNLITGFDSLTGEFKRSEIYKKEWNFCYHMHGSVHFDQRGGKDTEMHKIFWNSDLNSVFAQNSSGRNSQTTTEGRDHLTSAIIAGLDKANQLVREPFGPFYMQLDRLVYESDAIVFMGYGFNDLHLNASIHFVRFDPEKKRKIVVIDYASESEDGLQYRYDNWTHGLGFTVPYNGYEMGTGRRSEPNNANYFKKKNIFEKCSNPDYPLAVWYNGLMEACKQAEVIRSELL